jgi:hypothetical protein
MSQALKVAGASASIAPSKHRHLEKKPCRRCNLCADEFEPRTVFDRYCQACKEESELLKFSEWLPELDAAITERISA